MSVDFGLHFSCQSPEQRWRELYECTVEQAALGEELGYSSVFAAEHHFLEDGWIPAPMVLLGGISAVTSSIAIGTDVVVLPLHHPVTIAEQSTVLDLLSNGRFRLGVAIGWRDEEFRGFGVEKSERVARLESGVEFIRRLFTDESVTFQSDHYDVTDLSLMPQPVQDPIPI